MANEIPAAEIVRELLKSRLYDLKDNRGYLRGKCPQCGKNELYISRNFPYVLRCSRQNKCAFEQTVRDALPELFTNFAERFPPTETNPHATADSYLAMDRGFDIGKIRGWYEQATFQFPNSTNYIPTVRFYLDVHRTRWWERLIGRSGKDGKGRKAHFGGQRKDDGTLFSGDVWMPQGMAIEKGDRVFIVEGIFHAIALWHAGYKAVACFSANTFPHTFIDANAKKGIRWIVGMDADGAGDRWSKRHYRRLKNMGELASVCLPPRGKGGQGAQDWDDLWRGERLDAKLISRGLYHGRLAMSESVEEKAYHYYVKKRRYKFLLDFDNSLYWIEMEDEFKGKAMSGAEEFREAAILAEHAARKKREAEGAAAAQEKDKPAAEGLVAAKDKPSADGQAEARPAADGQAEARPAAEGQAEAEPPQTTEPTPQQQEPQAQQESPFPGKVEIEPGDPEAQFLATPDGRNIFRQHCNVMQISNVFPHCQYITRDNIMDEIRYVFSVAYANGTASEVIPLEGTAITNPSEFNKALLNRSLGGTFYGDAKHFKILRERWLNKRLPTVSAIPFVGYDQSTKAYIFKSHAWHQGRRMNINDQGYFEINRQGVKSTLASVSISTEGEFSPGWLPDFVRAFHWQGLSLLAFWLGSLFVQQIRSLDKSFPLFEYTGDPGAGKSTALEFCWKLVGRDDYEGFDLLKSTQAGRRRAFSQVSNLPVVIIESDRDNGEKDSRQKQFGFDEVKPFYNGRGTGTLGVSRRGNETDESVFQASLIISQNAEVEGSEALLQRIVHCHADKKHHGEGSRNVARWFERQKVATVGGFMGAALEKERQILEVYSAAFAKYEAIFTASDLRNERIIKNHAQVAACGDALSVVFGERMMTPELKTGLMNYLLGRALAREKRLLADHPLVEQFWEIYDFLTVRITRGQKLDPIAEPLNHSRDNGQRIAINLNQMMEECRQWGQPTPDTALLKKLLPHCRRHKFIGCKAINSRLMDNKTLRCWVFSRQAAHKIADDDF